MLTENERKLWTTGRQVDAVRLYRNRVRDDATDEPASLPDAAEALEKETGVARTFQIAPTARLGRPCGNPDCCPPDKEGGHSA